MNLRWVQLPVGGEAACAARLGARVTALAIATGCAGWAMLQLFNLAVDGSGAASTDRPGLLASAIGEATLAVPPVEVRSGRQVLTQDEWHERIRAKDFWSGRRSGPSSPYSPGGSGPGSIFNFWSDPGDRARNQPAFDDAGDTYRTVCVRLCDGFYWPISYSTTRDRFERDQTTCESSCNSPARLYVYRNPGADIDEMKTVDSEPYSKLPTAFKYRTSYDAQCRCGPQPWEREAMDRHRVYALESAVRKGDRSAAQQIVDLKARTEAERRRKAKALALAMTSVRNGMLAVRQPVAANVPAVSTVMADDAPTIPLQATGRVFAELPVTIIRGPVIVSAGASVAERPVGPVAVSKTGPVIIMRLGVGGADIGITRKAEPSARSASPTRRERQLPR